MCPAGRSARPRPGCRADRRARSRARTRTRSARARRSRARSPSRTTARPQSTGAGSSPEQLGEIVHDDVGAVLLERLALADAVDTDDEAEVARASGRHSRERVLEHRRLPGLEAQSARRVDERLRRGLSLEVLLARDGPVDDLVEEVVDAGGDEHVLAVRARRHDGARETGVAHRVDVLDRAVVCLYALLSDQLQHELVLQVPEAAHGLGARGVAGIAL